MISRFRTFVFVAAFVAMVSPAVFAQNTTYANRIALGVGVPAGFYLGPGVADAWYWWYPVAGRSYCVESAVNPAYTNQYSNDTVLYVYRADGTTLIGSNDDGSGEPTLGRGSRVCWVADSDAQVTVDLKQYGGAPAQNRYYSVRIVETTLWSSWYFVGGDYNSFLLMRNTTGSTVHFVATWRNAAGTVVGTSGTLTVPAHGGVGINAKTYITDPVTNYNGTIDIAMDGSPDALVGQMTSLSSTTGLGFDAPLFQRKPW
jgi:hypothetical protein